MPEDVEECLFVGAGAHFGADIAVSKSLIGGDLTVGDGGGMQASVAFGGVVIGKDADVSTGNAVDGNCGSGLWTVKST